MADANPSLSELVERAIRADRSEVHVSMPGEVVSYDAATQTASVRPALRRVLPDEEDELGAEELPVIENVPVSFPGGAGFTIHFPLTAGDTGDLLFSTYSHNEWQGTGQVSTPGDLKTHSLGAAKFYPGLRHKKNAAPDTDRSIGVPGGLRFHFETAAISAGTGLQFVVLADLLVTQLNALKTAISGAAVIAGDGGAAFKANLIAALASWPGPVASGNLKASP